MNTPFTFTHTTIQATAQPMPAIVLLHGMGSNEQDLQQLLQGLSLPAHVFAIRGPISHPPGYAFFQIGEEEQPVRQTFDKVIVALQQFIEEIVKYYNVDPSRILLVGFNQGAVIAQTAALTVGDKIAGFAALSGFLPRFVKEEYVKKDVSHIKGFISHGQYDYIYPYALGQQSANLFEAYEASVVFKSYADGHGVTAENRQDLQQFIQEVLV